ncbi:MAG: hypothetical protein CMJ87_13105 [Planctomycetes bacterium]|nr:hypothetical protein [Planctomycetota bacterium]
MLTSSPQPSQPLLASRPGPATVPSTRLDTGPGVAPETEGPAPESPETLHALAAAAGTPTVEKTDWLDLEPGGVYGVLGRPLLDWTLMVICVPLVGLISLPLALINWAVQGSWGKVFFRQVRVGRRGQRFVLYKFRTMRDAPGDEFEAWKEGDAGRVTRFGSFLRKSHLDELPQIINILRGEMSFIGPRPEMVEVHEFACRLVPNFERRLALRPGITGRAQITNGYAGHSREDYLHKLQEDEFYRTHYSLRSDLAILLRTPLWMLTLKGWLGKQRTEQTATRMSPSAPDGTGTVVLQPIPPPEPVTVQTASASDPPRQHSSRDQLAESDRTPSKTWAAL